MSLLLLKETPSQGVPPELGKRAANAKPGRPTASSLQRQENTNPTPDRDKRGTLVAVIAHRLPAAERSCGSIASSAQYLRDLVPGRDANQPWISSVPGNFSTISTHSSPHGRPF
jgi:hypothetical protein